VANELILVVDDNVRNRKLIRDTLQVKRYRTVEARTGEEGVRLARELRPNLILMDIQLPGINGITAFRQIRDNPATASIPVIAVSASAMAEDGRKIMASGFEGFQGKPLSMRELLETIQQVIARSATK
jgi:two-component system, cell cycle response regulator DivK